MMIGGMLRGWILLSWISNAGANGRQMLGMIPGQLEVGMLDSKQVGVTIGDLTFDAEVVPLVNLCQSQVQEDQLVWQTMGIIMTIDRFKLGRCIGIERIAIFRAMSQFRSNYHFVWQLNSHFINHVQENTWL